MPIFSRFGADFFTVYADFSRFVRDINGEKKNFSLSMSFFTVSFSRFAPSRLIRVVKTVFLENSVLAPYRRQVILTKMAKMTIYILPTKTRGCASQSPETNENDENGGCPSDKTRVCQKQGFRHPDLKRASNSLKFPYKALARTIGREKLEVGVLRVESLVVSVSFGVLEGGCLGRGWFIYHPEKKPPDFNWIFLVKGPKD